MIIEPSEGVVLAQLSASEWGNIPVPPKAHDSLTYGQVVAVSNKDSAEYGHLIGRTIHFRKYKDDARVGDNCVFIEIKDILGTSYNKES